MDEELLQRQPAALIPCGQFGISGVLQFDVAKIIVDLAFIQPLSRLLTSGAFGVAYKSHVCTLLVSFVAYIIANPSPKHKRSRPKLRATAFNFSIEFRSRTYESLHDSILRFAFQHDNIFYIGVSIFKKKKPAE